MDFVMSISQVRKLKHMEVKWLIRADFLVTKLGVDPGSQSPYLDHDHCSRETTAESTVRVAAVLLCNYD